MLARMGKKRHILFVVVLRSVCCSVFMLIDLSHAWSVPLSKRRLTNLRPEQDRWRVIVSRGLALKWVGAELLTQVGYPGCSRLQLLCSRASCEKSL